MIVRRTPSLSYNRKTEFCYHSIKNTFRCIWFLIIYNKKLLLLLFSCIIVSLHIYKCYYTHASTYEHSWGKKKKKKKEEEEEEERKFSIKLLFKMLNE